MLKQRMLTIGTSSSQLTIDEEIDRPATVVIQNNSTTDNLYIGNETVSSTNYGLILSPESVFSIDLGYTDKLYGIASISSLPISILIVDRA